MMDQIVFLSTGGLIASCILAIGAVGLSLTYAIFKFSNIAHADYMMVGAYVFLSMNKFLGLGVWLSLVSTVAITVVVCTSVSLFFFHRIKVRGAVNLLIISIGLSMILRYTVQLFYGANLQVYAVPLQRPYVFGPVLLTANQIITVVGSVLLISLVYLVLTKTTMGSKLRSFSDNPELCEVVGIDTARLKIFGWAVVSAIACVGGVLLGLNFVIEPNMGWNFMISIFAAAILGGMGNIYGALIGAALIGFTQEWSTVFVPATYKEVISFAVLTACLLLRPQGLLGSKS